MTRVNIRIFATQAARTLPLTKIKAAAAGANISSSSGARIKKLLFLRLSAQRSTIAESGVFGD